MAALFLTLIAAYALFMAFLYVFQRQLIYHPDKIIGPPEQYGLHDFSEHFARTSDGEAIHLWYRRAAPGFPTIAYFHGNSYNLADRAGIFAALASHGFGVLGVSYRGYGKSTGSPSEPGLYRDARAGLQFLKEQNVPIERTLLYGESLGTGVATQMAAEYDVPMLILQAPYKSVSGRAAELYSFVPIRLLIRDHFATIDKIGKVKARLLLLHGEQDVTIPIAHGRAVFDAATAGKDAVFFPEGGHNDFDSAVVSAHVLDLAKKYNLIAQ